MARARVETEEDDDEQLERERAEGMAQLNADTGGDLFAAIDQLRAAQGVNFLVQCLAPKEKAGYLGAIPAAEFSLEILRERFGGGLYKILVKGPKGFLPGGGNVQISMANESARNAPRGELETFVELMERRDRESATRRDRLMEIGIPALTSVLAAFIGRQPQQGTDIAMLAAALKGPSMGELATTMQSLQALSAPRADPFDTALKMMERVKDFATDGSEPKAGSSWLDVVRDLIREAGPMLGGVAQHLAAQQAQQVHMQRMRQPPSVTVEPTAELPRAQNPAPTSQIATSEEQQMLAMFKPMIVEKLKEIAGWAEKELEPTTYVEVFMDSLPSNIGQFLPQDKALEYVSHPDWYTVVCEWEPRLAAHKEWCEEFREYLLKWLKAPTGDSAPVADQSADV